MCLAALLGALVGTKTNSDFAGLAGLPPRTAIRRALLKGPGGADVARVSVWVKPPPAAATSLSLRNAEKVLLTRRCAGGKLCNCATVVTWVGAERCSSIFTAR